MIAGLHLIVYVSRHFQQYFNSILAITMTDRINMNYILAITIKDRMKSKNYHATGTVPKSRKKIL